jgi:hypothetical protein
MEAVECKFHRKKITDFSELGKLFEFGRIHWGSGPIVQRFLHLRATQNKFAQEKLSPQILKLALELIQYSNDPFDKFCF